MSCLSRCRLVPLPASVLIATLLALSMVVPSRGQVSTAEDLSTIEDRQRITALDVLVGLESDAWRSFTSGEPRLPRGLDATDFAVRLGALDVPVVAIESVERGRPVATEPWTVVVVLDVAGSRTRTLRWAASTLGEVAESLVGLGTVEIALWDGADEGLRTVLNGSRDERTVRERLSRLGLQVEGEDGLVDLRETFLRRVRDAPAAGPRLAREGRDREIAAILRHQDALLVHLDRVARRSGARRLLLWATGGFDTDPATFYDASSSLAGAATPPNAVDPVAATDRFIQTLAANGWVVVPVAPPRPDPLRGKGRGVRLGKWRFTGLMATYEAERDPERAEAYLTLGDAAEAQGDLDAALQSYEKAYYHFWGDPRTKTRQAAALVGMASVLERLERESEARRAREMAAELDPTAISSTDLGATGGLVEPFRVLQRVARQTGGVRVDRAHVFDELIEELRLRLRLTVQVEGDPVGEALPLAVHYLGEPTRRSARWGRAGPVARWAAARARLALLDGASIDGGETPDGPQALLTATEWTDHPIFGEQVTGDLTLELAHALPVDLRLTVAAARPGELPTVQTARWSNSQPYPGRFVVTLPTPCVAAVVWEDLDTGASGVLRVRLR